MDEIRQREHQLVVDLSYKVVGQVQAIDLLEASGSDLFGHFTKILVAVVDQSLRRDHLKQVTALNVSEPAVPSLGLAL